jgi:lipoyl(octanoyl) transferase
MDIRMMGNMAYEEALRLQESLQSARILNTIPDTLLLLEHPPVLTMGRRASTANILMSTENLDAMGVRVVDINRGGDVTYHGPGQLVGYPIFDLKGHGRDIRLFLERLEELFIRILALYGIRAHGETGRHTGVFCGTDKIVAFGISVRQWVTMHGFAFNVNTDLSHFEWIVPCGLEDRGVTSMQKLLGRPVPMDQVVGQVAALFQEMFPGNDDDSETSIEFPVKDGSFCPDSPMVLPEVVVMKGAGGIHE